MARNIVVAGAGTGSLTHEVRKAMCEADTVFADRRFDALIPAGKNIIDIKNYAEIESLDGNILILVSGDPGIFSLLPIVKKRFPHDNITVIPGVSSLQAICAYAGETWHNAAILSGHGRTLCAGKFLNTVERTRITVLFCDRNISPSWACDELASVSGVEVFIGSCIGGGDESFLQGRPGDFAGHDFPESSIILIRNNNPYSPARIFLRDKDFIREKNIVMTNESVRSVILSRLEMCNDSVLWDIGAGSGSVSVSAGNIFPYSDIHAVECNTEAVSLISRNATRFRLHNIAVHNSRALEVLPSLPEPTHVFIGGSGGELPGILAHVLTRENPVRVVVACVTLETFTEAYGILRSWRNFEAVQVSASSSAQIAPELTLMRANNSVMILSADWQNVYLPKS